MCLYNYIQKDEKKEVANKTLNIFLFCFIYFTMLGIEPRDIHQALLCKCSALELYPQPRAKFWRKATHLWFLNYSC